MRRLILARHAHAASNQRDVVSSIPPGEGLSPEGADQARALGALLAGEPIDVGVSSRLLRTQATLERALDGRAVPRVVVPALDEIAFGAYEGGPLEAYRSWAWSSPPAADPPGGGESRVTLALRTAVALETLRERPEDVVLVIGHALPLRYALDAAQGARPRARMRPVPHATPFPLEDADVVRAIAALRGWAALPSFADLPELPRTGH